MEARTGPHGQLLPFFRRAKHAEQEMAARRAGRFRAFIPHFNHNTSTGRSAPHYHHFKVLPVLTVLLPTGASGPISASTTQRCTFTISPGVDNELDQGQGR